MLKFSHVLDFNFWKFALLFLLSSAMSLNRIINAQVGSHKKKKMEVKFGLELKEWILRLDFIMC